MKWRGYYETFEEVWAENEDEAKVKLRAKMCAIFACGEADFTVWPVTDIPEPQPSITEEK